MIREEVNGGERPAIEPKNGLSRESNRGGIPKRWGSFYSASVSEFLSADPSAVIGQLASRHVAFHSTAEAEQVSAWATEIDILKAALACQSSDHADWWILIECPLLRLSRRIDTVVLMPGLVMPIEFKTGSQKHAAVHKEQATRYGRCLRDFHEASQSRLVLPVLCTEAGTAEEIATITDGDYWGLVRCNAKTLRDVFSNAAQLIPQGAQAITGPDFDSSPYRPTPTIVEAAQELYAGHGIADIGRGDAADADLQATAAVLRDLAVKAEAQKLHVVCFVTGSPGAGKTLLGLDVALKGRSGQFPAALLSGNRPLVYVLTEALAEDRAERTDTRKADAQYEASSAIQNLLGYLKQHTDGSAPPENIIVFDEAQRAWDANVGMKQMGRPASEPELFLEILSRLEWACLICLVGPGQEINQGEGGLPLWGEAIVTASKYGRTWRIVAAPQALDGGPDVAGNGLLASEGVADSTIQREPVLHLSNSIRSFRNPLHGKWVAELLDGEISAAAQIAKSMAAPPALITRDLAAAKRWLVQHREKGRSVGLLASSGASRLIAEGIPPTLQSRDLAPIGNWFLKPASDFRSGGALEVPLSEFGIQGLEIDYGCLCWDGDLIWRDEGWKARAMRAPRWSNVGAADKKRFRRNAYRVLLSRIRMGLIIFVPLGSSDDSTRDPVEYDRIAATLIRAGAVAMPPSGSSLPS